MTMHQHTLSAMAAEIDPWDAQSHDHAADEVHPARIATPEDAQVFVLAGNATLTLVSKKSRARYTYRVRSVQPDASGRVSSVTHFVSLLNGSDNESNYIYIGCIKRGVYTQTAKSKVAADASSNLAFEWFFNRALLEPALFDQVEAWHEGRCGACGRKLTVPESIARGLGPECAGKRGVS